MSISTSYKNIWKISFPIIISGVAQNIVNVTDTAFLGRLGEIELGAAGNAGIFYFVLVITGMGFTTGSQIIIGRRNGEKNYAQIGKVFNHTLYIMLPLALLFFGFIKFYSSDLLAEITKSENIYAAAIDFLRYRSWGIHFAFINFIFIAFYVGITNTKVLTYSTIIMSSINVLLDYGLIFGNYGFPEMGIKGAALASVIAEASALVFFIIYTIIYIDRKKYQLFYFKVIDINVFKRIFKIGSPVMLQNFLSLSSWFIFFMIIEKLGERELAISHIIRSLYMVLMIPLFGFSSATNTLVSNLIGQGNTEMVLPTIKKIVFMSLGATFLLLQFNIFIPEFMISIYTHDLSLISETINTLNVINYTMFFFCIAFILFNGVSGTGNTRVSLIIEAITITIYLALTYYIAIELKSSLPMVWCSEFIYFTLLGALSYIYLKKGNWHNAIV